MYKPVPQIQSSNEGEDSESELFNSSMNFDEKSLQYDENQGDADTLQQQEQPTMSTLRKIALTLSIVNCIAFIIIFLWILPCDYDTCSAPASLKVGDWEINLTGKGVQAMSIASSKNRRREMLVLLSSGTTNDTVSSTLCFGNESTNVLGIRAADGKIVWENNFTETVQYLNCSLIDVNNDGVDDCLLFPAAQTLSAFNSLTGALLWQLKNSLPDPRNVLDAAKKKVIVIESITDVSGDDVTDVIVILSDSRKRYLLVISGKNGELLWQSGLNESCITDDHSIASVISKACIKEPQEFGGGLNITNRLLTSGHASPQNVIPCVKCDTLTNGIPETNYLFHRNGADFLVRAMVNCSVFIGTLVKKNNL